MKKTLDTNVFDTGLDRMISLYEAGHRVVVCSSGGKDSTICVELAILAAEKTGRLPVEVAMRDEEIMFPGTFEYLERQASRPELDFHWQISIKPNVNYFNRAEPYWWVFDPLIDPEDWVRQPPEPGKLPKDPYEIPENHIVGMTADHRFPPPEGKLLYKVTGLRTAESLSRRLSIHSSKGWLTTRTDKWGNRAARPIYDWEEDDVWKAIRDNGWDYNEAYDVMFRYGVSKHLRRIAPPTMSLAGVETLKVARKAWPRWFSKLCKRLPGTRAAAMFGRRAVLPVRQLNESWEQTFKRECIEKAPAEWINTRCSAIMNYVLAQHSRHASTPFPDQRPCPKCDRLSSWEKMAKLLYTGDPFSLKQAFLKPVEPEYFREGTGTWGGSPTF